MTDPLTPDALNALEALYAAMHGPGDGAWEAAVVTGSLPTIYDSHRDVLIQNEWLEPEVVIGIVALHNAAPALFAALRAAWAERDAARAVLAGAQEIIAAYQRHITALEAEQNYHVEMGDI